MGIGFGAEAVGDVDARTGGEWEVGAAGGPIGGAAPAEGGEAWASVGLCEVEADVFVFDDARWGGEDGVAGEEDGFAVANAEGATAIEPLNEIVSEVGEGEFGVALDGCDWGCNAEGQAVGFKTGAEEFEALGGKREANGVGVAAETSEERACVIGCGDGVEQMETGDGAA